MRVVVFGSLNVDFVTRVPSIPKPGETVKGPSYVVLPGGKGANQALAAARCGARVAMAGAVGRDPFAAIALENLHAVGADCSAVARVDAPTGAAFISVDPAGENAIAVASGANAAARAAILDALALKPGEVLLMQREVPDAEVAAAAAKAHATGATVILNAAPGESFDAAALEHVDHLVVNQHEARLVARALACEGDEPRALARAIRRRCGDRLRVVVTLGAEGALLCGPEGMVAAPAPAVAVVDTTGAGDAFCGAYAALLARGRPAAEALAAGAAVASLACEGFGAQSGMPSAATIKSRLGY